MGETKRQTAKKNHNRPKAKDRGLYNGMTRSYYVKKSKPEQELKLF